MNTTASPTSSAQQPLKLIFRGRLDFGNERTFEKATRHWQNRLETYFKTDVLFKMEDVLDAENFALDVPQKVVFSTEKQWRNTTALLNEVAQYALAGYVGAWWVQNGRILDECRIEPKTDKAAVANYHLGCQFINEGGKEVEASEALTNAIEKYEKHALAYERRGYVNYKLKNYNDAIYDFSKSIAINPNNPEPFYSRGKVRMLKNEWEAAIGDFNQTLKQSLAVQPIHWLARLRKADSLYHAKRYQEAIPELKMFMDKTFAVSDPNFRFRSKAEYLLTECLKQV